MVLFRFEKVEPDRAQQVLKPLSGFAQQEHSPDQHFALYAEREVGAVPQAQWTSAPAAIPFPRYAETYSKPGP